MAGTFRSGGKPKPHGLRVLHGSKLRAYHRREAKYPLGPPTIPPHLATDPIAVEKWGILVDRLSRVQILTVAHGEALAVLVESWADYVRCREQFAMTGRQMVVVEEKKFADGSTSRRMRDNPLIRRSERLGLLLQRYLGEFGLTPATGARVAAGLPEGGDDDTERFLQRVT